MSHHKKAKELGSEPRHGAGNLSSSPCEKASNAITATAGVYRTYNADKNTYSVYRAGESLPLYEYAPELTNSLSSERLQTWMRSDPVVDTGSRAIWIWEPTQCSFHVIEETGNVTVAKIRELPVEARVDNIIFEGHLNGWVEFFILGPDDYPLTIVLYIDLSAKNVSEGYRYYTIAEEWKETNILGGRRGNVTINSSIVTAFDAQREARNRYSARQMMYELRDNENLRSRLGGGFRSVTVQSIGTTRLEIRARHDDSRKAPTDFEKQAIWDWINYVFTLKEGVNIQISGSANEWIIELDERPDDLFEALIDKKK